MTAGGQDRERQGGDAGSEGGDAVMESLLIPTAAKHVCCVSTCTMNNGVHGEGPTHTHPHLPHSAILAETFRELEKDDFFTPLVQVPANLYFKTVFKKDVNS